MFGLCTYVAVRTSSRTQQSDQTMYVHATSDFQSSQRLPTASGSLLPTRRNDSSIVSGPESSPNTSRHAGKSQYQSSKSIISATEKGSCPHPQQQTRTALAEIGKCC